MRGKRKYQTKTGSVVATTISTYSIGIRLCRKKAFSLYYAPMMRKDTPEESKGKLCLVAASPLPDLPHYTPNSLPLEFPQHDIRTHSPLPPITDRKNGYLVGYPLGKPIFAGCPRKKILRRMPLRGDTNGICRPPGHRNMSNSRACEVGR